MEQDGSSAALRRLQRKEGDLRRAVEAEGDADCADATVDIELHVAEMEESFGVDFTHGWKHERAEEGQPDLAAVGVAGEHDIDQLPARMLTHDVGVVGLMRHQDDGPIWLRRNGEFETRVGGAGIVDAGEPEARAVALDGNVGVDEHRNAVGGKRVDDQRCADCHIMVAQAGKAQRAGEGAEDLGAVVCGRSPVEEGERAVRDEVSGEQDHIGGKSVDVADDPFEEERLCKLVEVDVADLRDAEAVEGAGEVRYSEGAGDEIELVAGDFAGVEGKTRSGRSCADEEMAAGDAWGGIAINAGHRP